MKGSLGKLLCTVHALVQWIKSLYTWSGKLHWNQCIYNIRVPFIFWPGSQPGLHVVHTSELSAEPAVGRNYGSGDSLQKPRHRGGLANLVHVLHTNVTDTLELAYFEVYKVRCTNGRLSLQITAPLSVVADWLLPMFLLLSSWIIALKEKLDRLRLSWIPTVICSIARCKYNLWAWVVRSNDTFARKRLISRM